VLRGEPGIGKSSLLSYAATKANEWRVLRASGTESEAELPFAALDQLLRPLHDYLAQIPVAQARALEGALALGAPSPADRFTAAVATVSILAVVADEGRPLLCLIDDAHWLDAGSAEALVFASRRFRAEKIVVLFAARESEGRFLAVGLPELHVGSLDDAAAREVLGRAERKITPPTFVKLLEIARGNPLALIELPSSLTEAQRAGREPLSEPLTVGASIEQAFLGRTRSLPAETQRALVISAASDNDELKTLLTALFGLGLRANVLEPAESVGLLVLGEGRFDFRHPLMRSAVYQAASPAERRAAHRTLADALVGDDQKARRAWHSAAATIGPDEDVAAALEQAGREALARGGYATAATTLERAAHLSVQEEVRARRLLAAGEAFWIAGHSEKANALLIDASSTTVDSALRADIAQMRGRVSLWTGPVLDAHRRLRDEAERIAETDPSRAAILMAEAVLPSMMSGDVRLALRTAQRASTLAEPLQGFPVVMANLALGQVLALRGDTVEARLRLDSVRAALGPTDPFGPGAMLTQIASCLTWLEDYEQARLILTAVVEAARTQGAVVVLPFALAIQSEYDFRVGNFAAAYAGATESVALANQTHQETEAAFSYVTLARSEAVLGRDEACQAHVRCALDLADRVGARAIHTYAASALGLLNLTLGRVDEAIAALNGLQGLVREFGLDEPATVQWAPDLIECFVQQGMRSQAEEALAAFAEQAHRTRRMWAMAATARCRGLLAPDTDFERHFGEALAWHARTPTPFESARTELTYGQRLRRSGLRIKARERLHSALAAFEAMRAHPWVERARAELRASGERLRPREETVEEQLTGQELQVALVVADGATNREAAARLFLSPKTIEFHLSHIFRKLGVRSRTELARRFARHTLDLAIALLLSSESMDRLLDTTSEVIGLAL
jgi:DNA-binding CsgD family transcriptional regulator